MPKIIDYTGKKYSHLVFTHRAPSRVGAQGAYWYTICDCGNTREVEARQVTAGRVHSCGKCELGRDLAARGRQLFGRRRSLESKLFRQTVGKAAREGVAFSLIPSQFMALTRSHCIYCNQSPLRELHRIVELCNGGGYTVENSITCCPACMTMRGKLNHQEFLDRCRLVVHTTDVVSGS